MRAATRKARSGPSRGRRRAKRTTSARAPPQRGDQLQEEEVRAEEGDERRQEQGEEGGILEFRRLPRVDGVDVAPARCEGLRQGDIADVVAVRGEVGGQGGAGQGQEDQKERRHPGPNLCPQGLKEIDKHEKFR